MTKAPLVVFRTGEKIRVRAEAGRGWVDGEVHFASGNGKSLALALEQTLGTGRGFALHRELKVVMLLLSWIGEETGWWEDVQLGTRCELEREEELR